MKKLLVIVSLVVVALSSLSANDQRARVLMQAAEAKAKVEGDLTAAIRLYQEAEKEAGTNRALVAQALLKSAEAHEALGAAEAQKIYQRLVRDFADQKEAYAQARAKLGATRQADAATILKDVERLDGSGNVSADGRYATYVNWDTGNIAVRDLRTGVARDITSRVDFDVYDPVMSRDGRFVAYQSFNGCVERRPFAGGHGVLCVLSAGGEPAAVPRTVLDREDVDRVTPMDWSPTGRSIAVSVQREDGSAQIGLVSVTDGSLRVLRSIDWRGPTRIFFSPDGRYVAFDVPHDDSTDLRDIDVVAVDGSRGGRLVEHPSQDVIMGWTPDGRHLLFASDRGGTSGLWAQHVADGRLQGGPRLVHAGLGGFLSLGVTQGGALYFAVQSGGRDIEVLEVDFVAGKQVSPPARPVSRYVGTNLMPAWSPDGKSLAYVSQRGISGNTGRIIGIRDMETGATRELPPRLNYMGPLGWAPDGRALVTAGTDLKGRQGMFRVDADTGDLTRLGEGGHPRYAPGGSRLFHIKEAGKPFERMLVERDLTSGAERTLYTGEFATFSVSPDGQSIALTSGGVGDAAAHAIQLIRVETGDVRELLRAQPGDRLGPYIALPWTPDGQALIVRKRDPAAALYLVPISGAPPRRIAAEVEPWAFGTFGVISLHPDGRRLAGTRVSEGGGGVRVLENFVSALK